MLKKRNEGRHMMLALTASLFAILSMVAISTLQTKNNAMAQAPAMPVQTPDNQTITARGNATIGNETSSNKANGPALTLLPSSGTTGSNITILGNGFSPAQTFAFTIDGKYLFTGTMIENATGEFRTTALIPSSLSATTSGNTHEVKVSSSKGENATAQFTLTQGTTNATSSSPTTKTTTTTTTNSTVQHGTGTMVPPQGNLTSSKNSNATSATNRPST